MVHVELTEISNATTASFVGEPAVTTKILVELELIATVADSEIQIDGMEKGARVELRTGDNGPRRVIEVVESYAAVRSMLSAYSTIVTA